MQRKEEGGPGTPGNPSPSLRSSPDREENSKAVGRMGERTKLNWEGQDEKDEIVTENKAKKLRKCARSSNNHRPVTDPSTCMKL